MLTPEQMRKKIADFNNWLNGAKENDRRLGKLISVINGKPKRDTVINKEDILNLKIALNTSHTLEEFLERI